MEACQNNTRPLDTLQHLYDTLQHKCLRVAMDTVIAENVKNDDGKKIAISHL